VGHANIQVPKNQTREFLFDMGDRLINVYVSDNDGASNDHLPLGAVGHGGVDWQREVSNFRAFGYDRTVTLEVNGDRRWLLASRVYLQELWAKD
jgi:sugar phosphate isomerase/epimerase